ncbi:MAG: hypothetical protein ACE5IR_27890, partial [bacterium]
MRRTKLEGVLGKASADTVGTLRNFFVFNFETTSIDEITAELRVIGNLTQIWVDTTELANQHVTQTEVDSMKKALEVSTPPESRDPNQGIIELDDQFFGLPPNFDGDGVTDFLMVDIQDPEGVIILGFFTSRDQIFNAEGSNRRDILYIDTSPGIFFNDMRSLDRALQTLSHEYQHLIHFAFDTNEISFVNEGLSDIAELICGYDPFSLNGGFPTFRYFNDTDIPLFDWDNVSGSPVIDHSRAVLFFLYYLEQLGDESLKKLVAEFDNGKQGIVDVMADLGVGFTFEDLFTNFCVANYVNDRSLNPAFGYIHPVNGLPVEVANHTDPNQNAQNQTVNGLAVDYVVYSFGDSLKITFTGGANLLVKAFKFGSIEVEDVPLGSEYSVPDFGSTIQTVVFAVINTAQAQAVYSYTSEGQLTGVLDEIAYDDGMPDVFVPGTLISFLTHRKNREGWGWAVKFTPDFHKNTLLEARILAGFDQEFGGPPDAEKDFLFHVWDDNNGQPGNDIITPRVASTDRTTWNQRDFMVIDLSEFKAQLTDLGTVYIGFTEDDSLSTAVGMDNTTSENFTFAFRATTDTWVPLSDQSVEFQGTEFSLAGFNMMMRASFEYLDDSAASFIVGFFQNPIFTEQLDVFIVGQSRLNRQNLSATLTQGTQTSPLSLSPVPNTNDLVFFDDGVTLESSGTITIQVRGTTKYGFNFGEESFDFNAELISSARGGLLTATDGKMQLNIPQNALREDAYLISFVGNADV